MRYEVRIGGFGGQGIITMGHLLGTAASLHLGLKTAMTESYGPEARGGACKTDIVVSDAPIDYPKTISLDCLVAMNPDAYNSYVNDVRRGGTVIYDSSLFEIEERVVGVKYYGVESTRIAQDLGAAQTTNIVMLGALSRVTRIFPINALGNAVRERFSKSAEINLSALKAGAEAVNP